MPIISSPAAPFKGGTVPNATTFIAPVTVAPTTDADALTITTHGPQSFFDNIIVANSSDMAGVFTVDNAGEITLKTPAGSKPLLVNTSNVVEVTANGAVAMSLVSPLAVISSGALPTLTLSSGVASTSGSTREVETHTPITTDGTANAATCVVALSPDNVTYTTLVTLTVSAGVNALGASVLDAVARLPVTWFLKLTVSHATIGTTTYY